MQLPCLPLNVGVPDATQACRTGLELGYAACLVLQTYVPTKCKPQAPGKVSGATLREPNCWVLRPASPNHHNHSPAVSG